MKRHNVEVTSLACSHLRTVLAAPLSVVLAPSSGVSDGREEGLIWPQL